MDASGRPCLKFAVMDWMPFIKVYGSGNDGSGGDRSGEDLSLGGSMIQILDIIVEQLKTCYRLVFIPHRNVGFKLANGSWTGVMGKVARNEVDMSGLGFSFTPKRFKDLDISEFLYMDEVTATYRRPTMGSNIASFSYPFVTTVWNMMLVFFFLVSVVCCLVSYAHHKIITQKPRIDNSYENNENCIMERNKRPGNFYSGRSSFGGSLASSMSWTLGTLLSQSLPELLKGDSIRVVGGVWMLLSVVMASVYRSNLKAMIILPSISLPFDNLQELAVSHLPICTNPGSMFHQGIVNSPDNTSLGQIKHQLAEKGRQYEDVACDMRGLLTGSYVAIGPMTAFSEIFHQSFSVTGKCNTYVMSEKFFKTTALGLLFPKNSTLKFLVDPIIIRLRESGILTHIYNNGVFNATECLKPPSVTKPGSASLRAMGIHDVLGVFLVYLGGVVAAGFIFSLEVFFGKLKKSTQRFQEITVNGN